MADNNEEIVRRLAYLEREVAELKQQQAELLGQKSASVVAKKVEQENKQPVSFSPPPSAPPVAKEIEEVRPEQTKKEFDLEKMLSKWLPKMFMFILLLGVLWGLKVAVDNGYVTNAIRIVGGYAGTGILYYFGMKYFHKQNKVFGFTLLGGFIALGILTTFAAHHLYGYFNFITAFIIGVAYIGAGLWLSEKTKSETLTIFSAIAGFLLPFLLEGEGVSSYQFCAYILLLFLSLFYVSLRQQHKYTFYITLLLFHLTLLVYGVLIGAGENTVIVGTVLIQHLALLLFYLTGKISRHVFTEALIYTNFVFTIGWIKILDGGQETWIYGLFALLYVAITVYFFMKKDELLSGVLSAVAIFAISTFILSFSFDETNVTLLLLLINGTAGVWIGLRFNTLRTLITGSVIYVLSAYTVCLLTDITEFLSLEHGVWLAFLYSIVLIYYTIYEYTPSFLKGKKEDINISLIIGQVIVLIYAIRMTHLALQNAAFHYNTLAHIYGLVIIAVLAAMYLIHKWPKGLYVAHAVVVEFLLLGFVLMVTGLYNFGDKSLLLNLGVEIIYMLILIMIFIGIMKERFYIHLEGLKKNLPILAIGLQTVLFIYLNKWTISISLFYEIEVEYFLLVHTFILFAFSFASISIGKRLNWKPVKYFGAVLILIGILKLFFVDLGTISILIRAILFMIVGVVGLLYSRTLFKEE